MKLPRIAIRKIFCASLVLALAGASSAQERERERELDRDRDREHSKEEKEDPDALHLSDEWFRNQRSFPQGFIPAGAKTKAWKDAQKLVRRPDRSFAPGLKAATQPAGAVAGTWTPIGPSLASLGGRVQAIAVDPTTPTTVYVGGPDGGVWKSTNSGTNWTPIFDSQPTLSVASIAIAHSASNTIYVGTGDPYGRGGQVSYMGAGVFRSTNGGTSWTQLLSPLQGIAGAGEPGGGSVDSIAVSPTTSTTVLAAIHSGPYPNSAFYTGSDPTFGIWRSTDGGNNWTHVYTANPIGKLFYDPTNATVAWASQAAGTAGVLKSTDGGATWLPANGSGGTALPSTDSNIELAVAPSSTNTLYAGPQDPNSHALLGLYRTTDGGATWSQVAGAPFYCTSCDYANVLAVSPTNPNYVLAGGFNLYRSQDGGATWNSYGDFLHVDHHAIAFSPDGLKLFEGNDGGIVVTTHLTDACTSSNNCGNLSGMWFNSGANNGLQMFQFYPGMSMHPTNADVSLGGTQDNGLQLYSGTQAWTNPVFGDGGWTAIDFTTPTTMYGALGPLNIFKSTNGGANWAPATTGIVTTDPHEFIVPFVMDPSHSNILYVGTDRVYQSTNNAGSWSPISPHFTSCQFCEFLSALAVSKSTSDTVYAGTSLGHVQVTHNASAGVGATWAEADTNLPGRYITWIAVDTANSQTAYATASSFTFGSDTKGHVFKTVNGGTSWTDISGNLPNIPANVIVIDGPTSTLYVGTDIGIFQSTTSGGTWNVAGSGLPSAAVLSLVINTDTRLLRAGTFGRGAFDLTLPAIGPPPASLSINKSHSGNFTQGQNNVTYTVTVSNASGASATSGTVTVTDQPPTGLTVTAMSGSGWTCTTLPTCTRSSVLNGGASYPSITVTANVASNATSPLVNAAVVSGGGSVNANTTDPAFVFPTNNPSLQFVPVTPCRVFDTRNANGTFGGPFIAGGATRNVPVPTSACSIPAGAAAYSLNITVVPRVGTLGYLTVWPTGQTQPGVSTLNSPDGSTLANAAIVPAGTGGSISVFALQDTDVVIDINGYFVTAGAGTLQFFPLTPCRVLDTRSANGTFGGPAIAGQTSRSFPIRSSACSVPATATAYSFNVTVSPHGFLGFVTAWPTGQTQPNASTLNSLDGTILANAAIVPAGTNGAVSFYANNTTDLIVDINGYFAPPAAGGLNFHTVTPCRVVDTRNADGSTGGPIVNGGTSRTFPLPDSGCVPTTAAAYSLNVTVVPSGFLGFLTAWPTGQAQPNASTLNAQKGIVVANAAILPAGTAGSIDVFASSATHVIIDTNGYFQ
jgi:uncharacterized repeat protein (TIGR01451 family)